MNGNKINIDIEYFYTLQPDIANSQQISLIKTETTYKQNDDKWFM